MWFTSLDIVNTRGGQAGMHNSQPLHSCGLIVTVPRVLTITELTASPPCRQSSRGGGVDFGPRGTRPGGDELGPGADRLFVAGNVLGAGRAQRRAPAFDHRSEPDQSG